MRELVAARVELGGVDCGKPCCPECAVALESVSYCASCARTLLGPANVRANEPFDLR
jgi:hypothetical protein